MSTPYDAPRPAPSADQIKAFRQALGMSQQRFAAFLGISMGAVRKWENAEREPRALYLERLLERMDEHERRQGNSQG